MGKKSKGKKKGNQVKQVAPDKKYGPVLIVGFVIIAAFVLIVTAGKDQSTGTPTNSGSSASSASAVQQTDISPEVAANKITVDEAAVRKAGSTYFEYKKNGKTVPLMAYVGPSGKIITAVSMCEPCKGQKFRIEGDKLICNTCGTIFEIETHKGISGACVDYEPELLQSTIENGKIVIQESAVAGWQPRV